MRIAVLLFAACMPALAPPQDPVAMRVDASVKHGPLKPIWPYFGYDEPNYTYTEHGVKLIAAAIPSP